MIHLEDSIVINASCEKVYNWLIQKMLDKESYRAWHPEHVDIKWIKGEPFKEGSIIYAEEYLDGFLHKLKFKFTKIVPNHEIKYRPLFPLSLIATGNKFIIEKNDNGTCTFTASGTIRFPKWLFKKLHKNHAHKIEATEQHMKEEGENLKKAVES